MKNDTEGLVWGCGTCQKYRDAKHEEAMIQSEQLMIPWNKVGIESFSLGRHDHLIIIDYYVNFLEVVMSA